MADGGKAARQRQAKGAPRVDKKKQAAARKREAARRQAAREQKQRDVELGKAVEGAPKGAARTMENAELYARVFNDWVAGMDYQTLSERHGLSVRRVSEVIASLREARIGAMRMTDPLLGLRTAQDLVLRWSGAIAQYAQLAADSKQETVKLGALKRRDEAVLSFTTLMQELGYLPRHLGTLRIQEDFLGLVDVLLDKMGELGIPEEHQRALVESVELRVVKRDGRMMLAAPEPDVIDAEVSAA